MIIPTHCPICKCILIENNEYLFCPNNIGCYNYQSHYWLKHDPNKDYPFYEGLIIQHKNKLYSLDYSKATNVYRLNELNNKFLHTNLICKFPPPENYTPITSLFNKIINLIHFS